MGEYAPILSSLTDTFSVSSMIPIIAGTLAAAAALVFMWWAIKKVIRIVQKAFKSGKMTG